MIPGGSTTRCKDRAYGPVMQQEKEIDDERSGNGTGKQGTVGTVGKA